MHKLNEFQKVMLILSVIIVAVISIAVIIYTINFNRKDILREFDGENVSGCIYSYIESEYDESLYIVVGHLDKMYLLILPDDVYDSMEEDLRTAIIDRKTGFYVDFSTVTTKSQQMFNGYKRISAVCEYNLYGTTIPHVN